MRFKQFIEDLRFKGFREDMKDLITFDERGFFNGARIKLLIGVIIFSITLAIKLIYG